MRRELVLAGCLVVLAATGAVALTAMDGGNGTADANDTDGPSTPDTTENESPMASNATDGESSTPAYRLNRTINGTAVSALARANGSTFVGGTAVGNGSLAAAGNATVLKIGPDGERDWTYRNGSADRGGVAAVAATADGGAYALTTVTNYTESPPLSVQRLVRFAPDGEVRWRTTVPSTGSYYAPSTPMTLADDGVVLAGVVRQGDESAVALRKVTADGETAWNRTYEVEARPTAVRVTDDGVVVAGTADFGNPWLLRTDTDGTERFNRTYERADRHRVHGAVPTDDGGVLLAGSYSAGSPPSAWASRIGPEGEQRWSRVYDVPGDARVRSAVPDGEGVTLVAGAVDQSASTGVVGVGPDGVRRYAERIDGVPFPTAADRANDRLIVGGVVGLQGNDTASEVRTVDRPAISPEQPTPDATVSANGTFYRGQDLLVEDPDAAGDAVALVALPHERDDGGERVVRRPALDDEGRAVVETATLRPGEYALRVDGERTARFDLRGVGIYHVETDRTFVDRAAGERDVTLRVDGSRSDYAVYVRATRSDGTAVDAATLRAAFGEVPGFTGIERPAGDAAARIAVGEETTIDAAVGAFDPGMYDLQVRSTDTADAGAVGDARVVVGPADPRPVDVSLERRNLTAPVDGEATTNVSVSGATHGISAIGMSAERTGEPAIRLAIDASVDASHRRSGGMWSDRRSTADLTATDAQTSNGTVQVATVRVLADERHVAGNGTNEVTVGVDWLVDERGRPYTVPDDATVTVTVAGNVTGDDRSRSLPSPAAELAPVDGRRTLTRP